MAVYLDIIWALNFLFDSLLLYLTAIILKREVRLWRIFAGGLIGSIIILLVFTPLNSYSGHPITKLCFSIVMVFTVFGFKRLRTFLKSLMTFYFSTFLIGGSLIGIHYFIKFDFQASSSVMMASVQGFGDPISWLFVLLGFPLVWHFSKRNIEGIEMTKIQYDSLIKVLIVINGTEYRFTGLIDSGNQLYDPISKMPVMFISIEKRLEEFPEEIIKIAGSPEEIMMGNDSIGGEWDHKMRVIPCKVVGQEHQLIIAFKPDRIAFEKDDNETIEADKGLVSFSMQQLSADDAFQCIVHPKMLTGRSKTHPDAKVS
ncbi:sigma-E processing peptidase SpoIIGA [Cytobacillus sp. NCCP-133]|uniref:sigma-E processing peptidase SpoIIGA n=1 Tax=Cytobacillus sp. NCCP-133 TaxID=766848 RepID=UPI00222F4244|nr:sigma-E processing peptidase SpoIIGA [Cytobacillus sp. NCCP-133]GLB61238.1 sporulation sigma-E factor-processing peptidase [Cytobacillus sp. NCCP-133]